MVCEPLLGPVGEIPEEVEWVVLGADTKKYKDRVIPKEEWVDGIEADCEKKGIPLFMGSSIEAYASNPKKQYPEKLKRGVLSEDGIWNMLERNRELLRRLGISEVP